jgi:hypothetical protein
MNIFPYSSCHADDRLSKDKPASKAIVSVGLTAKRLLGVVPVIRRTGWVGLSRRNMVFSTATGG